MMGMRGMMGSVAICVAGEHVYVVKGNTLYKFKAEDLTLVAKVALEKVPERGGPSGRGERRGGQGRERPDAE